MYPFRLIYFLGGLTWPVVLAALVSCGGGGSGSGGSTSTAPTPAPPAAPNHSPVIASANGDVRIVAGETLNYDPTKAGSTFSDPDGDSLSYQVSLTPQLSLDVTTIGLSVSGTRIVGTPHQSKAPVFVGAKVTASDGRGGSITDFFQFVIAPNSPPVVANANAMQVLPVGAAVDVDATQAGATFRDPDGDPLNYTVALLSPPNGLSIAGTRISGVLQSAALVRVSIVATDGISGSAENAFSIAGRGPEAGRPNLPAASYVYEDGLLALPFRYRTNTSSAGSFWDTTPRSNPTTNAGATLGRVLFYDKRLSVTNTMSCSSCHEQSHGFASSQRFNVGVQGVPLKRQAMPLANVRYNLRDAYFSDLRAQTLENLVLMPIQESTELGNSLDLLEAKLAATDFYPPLFTAAFGTPEVTRDRIAKAVAQFLRSMISYQSRFEQAFDTMEVNQPINPSAILTAQELAGQQVWATSTNVCGGCHTDFVFTTNDAQNNGLDATITDPGYQFGKFRAASLINIAVSGPYMHDGRFSTLREVIDHYDHGIQFSFNLPGELRNAAFNGSRQLNLSETDKQALEAFLNTLTDDKFLHDPKFSNPFP